MQSSDKFNLYGKNVVITGVSGGLGEEMVLLLVRKYNCNVIGIARNETKLRQLCAELGDLSSSFSYRIFDISNREKWSEFADDLSSLGFDVDVLINNAGILPQFTKFGKYYFDEIEKCIETNFKSVIYSSQIFLPLFDRKQGTAIINISSSDSLCPLAGTSIYSAGKAAVKALSETMREEYRGRIYIPSVCPGFICTDIMQNQLHNNNRIIDNVSMSASKAAKKILHKVNSRRSQIVIGMDAHLMSFAYRMAPVLSLRFFNFIIRTSKLDLFSEIYK